jgi:hypothetical protein
LVIADAANPRCWSAQTISFQTLRCGLHAKRRVRSIAALRSLLRLTAVAEAGFTNGAGSHQLWLAHSLDHARLLSGRLFSRVPGNNPECPNDTLYGTPTKRRTTPDGPPERSLAARARHAGGYGFLRGRKPSSAARLSVPNHATAHPAEAARQHAPARAREPSPSRFLIGRCLPLGLRATGAEFLRGR